jgi:hypothetical protein
MFLIQLFGPLFVLNSLEKIGHVLLEILIICGLFACLHFRLAHEIVEHLHDQVVIVSTLSELENYLAVCKIIVIQRLNVIYLSDYCLKLLVDYCRICEGVFGCQVFQNSIFDVVVNQL